MQRVAPVAGAPHRPAHGSLDEVPFVGCVSLAELEPAKEWSIGRVFPVAGERRDEGEAGAPHEFLFPARPLIHLLPAERRLVEEMEAAVIADRPVVETLGP